MADKSFGVKDINLIGASGTPTIESPNNLNINAINVAISTNATVGGSLDVDGNTELDDLNVSGVSTLGTVKISSGIVTATSGVVTYYGDGSALTGVGGATSLTDLSDATVSADLKSIGIGVDALINDDGTNNRNIGIGHSALKLVSTGFNNIAIGPGAGTSLTDGSRNILIGYNAGHLLQSNPGGTAWTVTAIGAEALENMYTSSGAPVAIGYRALREKDYGGYTVAIGGNVLAECTQNGGNHTVAIGYGVAQYTQTTNDLSDCVLIGSMVGERLRGNHCTFIGSNIAGNTFVDGSKNTFVGSHIAKGSGDPDSDDNTAVGYRAAYNIDDLAERNTLVGSESGYNLGNSTNNVLLGYQAGYGITSGGNNIVIGSGATVSSASTSNEITLGNDSITRLRIPGLQSTATDGQVLTFNSSSGLIEFQTVSGGGGGGGASDINSLSDAIATGESVGLGTGSLVTDDGSTNRNTAIGYYSLHEVTTAQRNVAVGYKAGFGITTGNNNVVIGADAGYQLTTQGGNVFVGEGAGQGVTGMFANQNIGIGRNAYGRIGSVTGGANIAIGENSLVGCTDGNYNVAVGQEAGDKIDTGSNNVCIGRRSGDEITTGDNNICIGADAAAGAATTSNEITLGNTDITKFRIPGIGITFGNNSSLTDGHVLTYSSSTGEVTLAAASGGGGSIGGATGVDFNDNVKVRFGDDNDMEQFFDGTRFKIQPKTSSTTSQLDFEAKDQVYIESLSNGIFLRASGNNVIDMYGGPGGGIYFHHNGNDKLKLEGGNWTTQGNADWTFSGTDYNVVFDASDSALEFADNAKAKFGAGDDLQIYHDSNNSYISDQGTGNLKVLSSTFVLRNASDNAFMLQAVANDAVKLFHNNTNRLETTGYGATITGGLEVSGIISATSFKGPSGVTATFIGDGSGLTGVTATGSGVGVQDSTSVVGTAQTINFGTNLTATISNGVATVDASGGGGGVTTGKAIAMAMIFG